MNNKLGQSVNTEAPINTDSILHFTQIFIYLFLNLGLYYPYITNSWKNYPFKFSMYSGRNHLELSDGENTLAIAAWMSFIFTTAHLS